MKKIDIIAGARPNFMKIGPIIHAITRHNNAYKDNAIEYRLIHTGQHYDKKMSEDFFEQLNIPKPDLNLGAGGGTQAEQTAAIMKGYEQALQDCHWVIATSSRQRHIPRPVLSPRQAAELMVTNFHNLDDVMTDSAHRNWQLAIVFGREDRGLTNEELQLADYHIQIPANPQYGVLNVAAAVQVIASVFYETAELALTAKTAAEKSIDLTFRQQWDEPPISNEQRLQLENRLLALLENLDIYNPAQSKVMPQRINRLLSRLQLDIKEYQLLQATIAKLLKS